jgi:glyoxylase-like metal-dependent hydrolase (beta-lactamase superfamily II)
VNPQGQSWTTLARLRRTHRNTVRMEGEGLLGMGMEPAFGIDQRAILVRAPGGNVLWDCISLLDQAVVDLVRGIGGVCAIAISHPHYYTSMVEWAHAFGCPVLLHADDRAWVMRPDPSIEFWEGETKELGGGMTLVRCGGHFPGACVLHVAGGGGALLSGDTLNVRPDFRHVSFMYSFPNLVPLSAPEVRRIVDALEPYAFDSIHAAWWGMAIRPGAKEAVRRSAERYIAHIEGRGRV